MKKILFLAIGLLFLSTLTTQGQTFQTWRNENTQNSWQDAEAFWNFPDKSSIVFGQQEWDNNIESNQSNDSDISTWRFLFKSGANSVHTFSGNKIGFYDFSGQYPMIINESSATHVINNNLDCDNTGEPLLIQIRSTGGLTFGGDIDNRVSTINVEGNTASTTIVTFNGTISGSGGFYKNNSNITVSLNGTNTFSGQTTIDAGEIIIGNSGSISNTEIKIGANGHLNLENSISVPSVSEIGADNGGAISISTNKTLTINGADKGTFYQNSISGAGNLVMSGTGNTTLALYGNQAYTGTTTINSGVLVSSANLASSPHGFRTEPQKQITLALNLT